MGGLINALAPGQFFEAGNQVQGTALTPPPPKASLVSEVYLQPVTERWPSIATSIIIIALAFLKWLHLLAEFIRACACVRTCMLTIDHHYITKLDMYRALRSVASILVANSTCNVHESESHFRSKSYRFTKLVQPKSYLKSYHSFATSETEFIQKMSKLHENFYR